MYSWISSNCTRSDWRVLPPEFRTAALSPSHNLTNSNKAWSTAWTAHRARVGIGGDIRNGNANHVSIGGVGLPMLQDIFRVIQL